MCEYRPLVTADPGPLEHANNRHHSIAWMKVTPTVSGGEGKKKTIIEVDDSETERESGSGVEVTLLSQKRPGGLRGIAQLHTFSMVSLHFVISFCLLTRTTGNISGTRFTPILNVSRSLR